MNAGHNWQQPPTSNFYQGASHHTHSGLAYPPPKYNTPQILQNPPLHAKKKKLRITPLKMTLTGVGMIPLFFLGIYISVFAGLFISWDTMNSEVETLMASIIVSLTLPLTLTFLVGSVTLTIWGAVLGTINIIKKKDKLASSIVSVSVGLLLLLGMLAAIGLYILEAFGY